MTKTDKPAYLMVCGTTLGAAGDPRYGELMKTAAAGIKVKAIASGEVGGNRIKVLEGELPAGTTFTAVEEFPSMAALEKFWFSDAYQEAIPLRAEAVKMNFVVAIDGISEADRQLAQAVSD